MITFTELMNQSLRFRNCIIDYAMRSSKKAETTRKILKIIDAFDGKSEKDPGFRAEYYNWLKNKKGYSTIKLRELCSAVGYEYGESLETDNDIDTIDTTNTKKKKNE